MKNESIGTIRRRWRRGALLFAAAAISLLTAAIAWAATGELSYQQRMPEFDIGTPTGIASSPDNANLYVAGDDSLTVLGRNPATGAFTYLETETDGVDDPTDPGITVNGLARTTGVVVSADGKNVYASGWQSDNAVAVFARDTLTGKLSFLEAERDTVDDPSDAGATVDFMTRPEAVAVSPDGGTVYATTSSDDSVVGFERDPLTGKLSYLEAERDGVNDGSDAGGTVDGLQSGAALTVAPDSEAVYVGTDSDDTVVVFQRDTGTGRLSFVEAERDGVDDAGDAGGVVNGLNSTESVLVSPDEDVVFAAGLLDSAVAVFERDTATEELSFIEAEVDGVDDGSDAGGTVDGLTWPNGLTISPSGNNLYVSALISEAVVAFRYVAATAELSFGEAEINGVNDPGDAGPTVDGLMDPQALTLTPDGDHVYVASSGGGGLAAFDRQPPGNPTFGSLSFLHHEPQFGLAEPRGVAVSPDSEHVFVATNQDESLRSFDRNPATGAVTPADTESEGVDDPSDGGPSAAGLNEPNAIAVSPDGAHVYVADTSTYSISTFGLNSTTGELTYIETEADGVDDVSDTGPVVSGLYEPWDVIVSPDGASVYGTANNDSGISAFTRNPATGRLTFVEAEFDGAAGADGLQGVEGAAISPDGKHLYTAGRDVQEAGVFSRDPATSALTFVEVERQGDDDPTDAGGEVDGLDSGPDDVVVSPDGAQVYFLASSSIAVFDRDPATGKLSFSEAERNGEDDPGDDGGAVDGLSGGRALAVSPDGGQVYAGTQVTPGTLVTFTRNRTTGKLTFLEVEREGTDDPSDGGDRPAGLDRIEDMAIAPDGRDVYLAASDSNSLTIFDREDDYVAPETSIDDGPPEGAATPDSTPSFTFSSSETPVTFACSVDGGALAACPTTLPALAEGDHSLSVAATDAEGNTDATPATRNFSVDTVAPETIITAGPTGPTSASAPSFTFISTEPRSSFGCRIDDEGFAPCNSAKAYAALADGEHTFRVRATDAPGNTDATPAVRTFTVDTQVAGAEIVAEKKQKQKGKKIKIKVEARADETATATASGKIVIGKKSYKLTEISKDLTAGAHKDLKLKPKKRKNKQKIADALADGKKAKAKLEATITDALGNAWVEATSVKLRR